MNRALLVLCFAAVLCFAGGVALASAPHSSRPPAPPRGSTQPAAAPSASAAASESTEDDAPDAAEKKVRFSWKPGPQSIDLGHDIALALPDRDAFLGPPEAGQLLEKLGNFHNENLLGVVVGKDDVSTWIVTIRYDEEGYVKDTDAINADELLSAIKEGTEEANQEREEHGFKPLHVTSWSEPPRYDKAVHHLVWALLA
jgi:uncharacterized membrane-anchored protein